MSKKDRFKKLAQEKTNEEVGGEEAKNNLLTETKTQTDTKTFTETKVPESIIPEPKIKFEKLRKRSTYWMEEEDIKFINKLSKKTNIPKYEILKRAVRMYREAIENERRTS